MSSLSKINPNYAGIDIGNESIFVSIEDCDVTSFGIFTYNYINLIAETGSNLQKHWMTEKHFSSWAAIAPNIHQSGKTNKRRKIKRTPASVKSSVKPLSPLPPVNIPSFLLSTNE